ncbi:MAG TPA: 30S ribosomal protein S20 [Polyangiales bacterium]|nr:30S ribosomal protein S20 [Polyangiales bacterium]
MASHESARKRIRQTIKRTERLRSIRSETRTYIKRLRAAIHKNDKKGAEDSLKVVISHIDRAVSKGVFHRRTGSRYIARLASQVSKLGQAAAV